MPDLRPLRDDDVVAAHEITVAAFAELDASRGDAEQPQPAPEGAHARIRHLMATDPGGAGPRSTATTGRSASRSRSSARASGLSLLVVRPDVQSAGAGGALLRAALGHGRDARGGVILGSSDPRALRAYHRAGFTMHPAAAPPARRRSGGRPGRRALRPRPRRRDGRRGRPRRPRRRARRGLGASRESGAELLALPGRGFVAIRDGDVKLVAAADERGRRLAVAHRPRPLRRAAPR